METTTTTIAKRVQTINDLLQTIEAQQAEIKRLSAKKTRKVLTPEQQAEKEAKQAERLAKRELNAAIRGISQAWTQERSLFSLINFFAKNHKKSDFSHVLSFMPNFEHCKSNADVKALLSIDLVKEILGEELFRRKDGEVTTTEKKTFSARVFAKCIVNKYHS